MRLTIVFLLCISVFPGNAADRALTPKDVARLRSVTSAEISPDGRMVAYGLRVQRRLFQEENGPAWAELHVWDEEHGSRGFLTGKVNVSNVCWMPDGSGIGFLAKRSGDKTRSVYMIPVAGGEARRVLTHDTDISQFRWMGDGSRIAFRAPEKKDQAKEKLEEKGFDQEIFEEDLTYIRVWIAELGKDEPEKRMLDLEGSANGLRVSPDGKLLALSLAPKPLVDHSYMYTRAHIVDASSGDLALNVNNPGKLGMVRWSPDGRRVAMLAGADEHDPNAGRLFVTNLETSETTRHFLQAKGDVVDFAWRGNVEILYLWDQGVHTSLRSLDAGSGESREELARAFQPTLAHAHLEGKVVVRQILVAAGPGLRRTGTERDERYQDGPGSRRLRHFRSPAWSPLREWQDGCWFPTHDPCGCFTWIIGIRSRSRRHDLCGPD